MFWFVGLFVCLFFVVIVVGWLFFFVCFVLGAGWGGSRGRIKTALYEKIESRLAEKK